MSTIDNASTSRRRPTREPAGPHGAASPATANLADALRSWRLAEAKRRRTPAYRVLTDQTLLGIAAARPASAEALLAVRGFGPKTADKYGAALLALIARAGR